MAIGELLSLTRGSVIELNRLAGESADIYVNEKLVGKGRSWSPMRDSESGC